MTNTTITMKEISTCSTWSKKDDSPRGCATVGASQIKPGDKVCYNNHFVTVIEDEPEMTTEREKLTVCEHCLMAIESHEGRQVTRTIYPDFDIDENGEYVALPESRCDWCEEEGFDKLYEIQ